MFRAGTLKLSLGKTADPYVYQVCEIENTPQLHEKKAAFALFEVP